MTYKNSILELILTDTNVLAEEHRYRTNAYRSAKKNNPFHVTRGRIQRGRKKYNLTLESGEIS